MSCIRIVLGELVKAIGLRGEIKLRESNDFWPEALGSGRLILVGKTGSRAVRIESERTHNPGMRVLQLQGIADRDAAESIVGAELVLEADELDVPEPPALRPFQLQGASVLLPDGSVLGSVADLLTMPAHDVLVVQGAEREYLIPVVPEIVKEVDLEAGRVRVDPPAGLLEL